MNIEMKFSFKAIKELLNETNTTLETIGELSKDLNNISTIAYIGNKHAGGKITKEEIEDMLACRKRALNEKASTPVVLPIPKSVQVEDEYCFLDE